ncbi:hypothetical protein ACI782_00745 [Geodermatophilus sp. SYSU D00703]
MSQDAAWATTTGGRDPGSQRAVRDTSPLAPSFTATVDQARGVVRARGHLDEVGADLLCGTVLALQRHGHRQITVRLQATVEPPARAVFDELTQRLAADGVLVVLE